MNSAEIQCSNCNAKLTMNTEHKALFCPCCGNKLYPEEESLYNSHDLEAVRDIRELIKLDDGTYCTKEYTEYEKKRKNYKTWHSIWLAVLVICAICSLFLYIMGIETDPKFFSDPFFYNLDNNPLLFTVAVNIYVFTLIIGLGGSVFFKKHNPEDRYSVINETRFITKRKYVVKKEIICPNCQAKLGFEPGIEIRYCPCCAKELPEEVLAVLKASESEKTYKPAAVGNSQKQHIEENAS